MAEMDKEDGSVCQFCWQGSEVENVAGQLHVEKVESGKVISAHHRCLQYASGLTQYKCEVFGGFDISEVEKEIARGFKLRCSICKGNKGRKCRGASCGCAVKYCRKSFHFPCASNDPVAVTKRLVVTKDKHHPEEKFVLYRVFCSAAHEVVFRKSLQNDLRGSARKKQRNKSLDSRKETHCSSQTEVSQEQRASSGDAHSHSEVTVSSPVSRSLHSPPMLTESPLPAASPESSSTLAGSSVENEDGMVSTENSDDNMSQEDNMMLSSPSVTSSSEHVQAKTLPRPVQSRQQAAKSQSGPVQSRQQAAKPDVSQPLLCRLSEELSTIHCGKEGSTGKMKDGSAGKMKDGSTGKMKDGSAGKMKDGSAGKMKDGSAGKRTAGSEQGQQMKDEVQNEWPSKEADFRTASPGEESVENKSPNIVPVPAKNPVKIVKALTDCLFNVENGLVLHSHKDNAVKTQLPVVEKVEASASKATVSCKKPAVLPTCPLNPGRPRNISKLSRAYKPSMKAAVTGSDPLSQELSRTPPVTGSDPLSQELSRTPPVTGSDPLSQELSRTLQQADSVDLMNRAVSESCSAQELFQVEEQVEVRKADSVGDSAALTTDSACDVRTEADSSTMDPDASGASGQEARCSGGSRKRKRGDLGTDKNNRQHGGKVSKDSVETACEVPQPECVLLIPTNMEAFRAQEGEVTVAACQLLKVGSDQVLVWQTITLRSLPAPLMLLFLLDLVRELGKDNREAVLDLLFNGDCLTSKLNNYLVQAQVFQTGSEGKIQEEFQEAVWRGLQSSVESLPAVHLIHVHNDLAALALDVPRLNLSSHVMASVQAYKGLFGWSTNMEASTFPLSPTRQRSAVQAEALALKMWLTRVNPITEVTLFPSDNLLLDRTTAIANEEFFRLADYLKQNHHTTIQVEDVGGSSVQRVVPLLVFQPVEVFMLNFQEYLQKACDKFFQTRGLVSGLALVPLSNLYSSRCEAISALLRRGAEENSGYRVSVYSAFCPTTQPITMVLLEICLQHHLDTMAQMAPTAKETAEGTAKETAEGTAEGPTTDMTLKRRRGRPRKYLNP